MTLDSLLTIVGLFIAVWALLPRSRKLDLRLRFTFLDWTILVGATVVVLYLQYYSVFVALGWHPRLALSRWALNPGNVSFIIVGLALLFTTLHIFNSRLTRNRLDRFVKLVEELLRMEEYGELLSVVEGHFDELMRIYGNDFLLPKLRRKIGGIYAMSPVEAIGLTFELAEEDAIAGGSPSKWEKLVDWARRVLFRYFGKHLPTYEESRTLARETVHEIFRSEGVVRSIVRTQPYFLLRMLDSKLDAKQEVAYLYFREMMSYPASILFSEIEKNQAVASNGDYELPESNRLLHFLFADAHRAEGLQIWRGVSHAMLEELRSLARNPQKDTYNWANDRDFEDKERWQSVQFVGLSFFDIMVTKALYQGIMCHMFLHALSWITREVVRNYAPNDTLADTECETGTRYGLMLWEITNTLRNWIEKVRDLPSQQENARLRDDSLQDENSNIIKSAILAMGRCVYDILDAENIPVATKHMVAGVAFRLYFELRSQSGLERYASVMISSLKNGGSQIRPQSSRYRIALLDAFKACDQEPWDDSLVADVRRILDSENCFD